MARLAEELPESDGTPLNIAEFSVNSVHASGGSDPERNLEHLRKLIAGYDWVMLTRLRQSYKLSAYLRRYSQQPMRFVMGVSTFAMLLSDKFYVESSGGLLEATGKLYANDVRLYVQPMSLKDFRLHLESVDLDPDWIVIEDESETVSIFNMTFKGPERLLQQYLMESGWVESLVRDNAAIQA